MHNKKGNFYGILLLVLLLVILMGLIKPKIPTGFAIKKDKCFEGTAFGGCSSVKPRYCDNGALKPNCQRCGCNADEVCQAGGTCLQKCSDGTLFGHCSKTKPILCHKGALLENCFECGCFSGQTCLNNGTCAGEIEVGAGAEAKKEAKKIFEERIIEECADGSSFGQCSLEKPKYCQDGTLIDNCEMCGCNVGEICSESLCLKKLDAGFWWGLFCKVLYYDEYGDCIADAIRYKNFTRP